MKEIGASAFSTDPWTWLEDNARAAYLELRERQHQQVRTVAMLEMPTATRLELNCKASPRAAHGRYSQDGPERKADVASQRSRIRRRPSSR
jgi:hypothetical protein